MSDSDLNQLRRDVEDLFVRMRAVEGLESPFLRSVYERFIRLITRVEVLEQVAAPVRLENLVNDVAEIKDDLKASRATVRSALITAACGIAVTVIGGTLLFVLLHGGPT